MKLIRLYLILLTVILLGALLHGSYNFIGVSSWGSGCFDAADKLGRDYGPEYKAYMDRFCDKKIEEYKKQFKLE